ncbi:MAG: outer membrane protein transport protein [Campylobacterota bacterium]
MKKIALMSLVASSVLMAGGYKIPEASLNAVALSAANIAHTKSADAAYYNPANMVFMSDENHIEADLTYIGLSAVKYDGTVNGVPQDNIESESENFLVPSLHYVSRDVSGAHFGLSVVVPGGLSKRWNGSLATFSAEEFTLETVEINPTVALPIGDKIGVAIGFRMIHSSGIVKATGAGHPQLGTYSQDMEGDSIDFGYNLALAYKPTSEIEVGLTYRSQIDLTAEGSAELHSDSIPVNGIYNGSLTVPIPAALSIAAAYTLATKTTVEFVYERTYWSAYEEIDFNYNDPFAEASFGLAKPKNWNDTNAFRLGVTQEYDNMTIMAGMVIDETPVPDETIGFELPDSDSFSVSLGGRYQIDEKMDVGVAALYSMREDRKVDNDDLTGEFTNSNALLISVGMGYKF